jgi:TolB-like protein
VAIAVLPFSDMSQERDQAYLCEGMAEEVMHALVSVEGIRVASRTSAFRARHDHADLSAVARAPSVNHILEGSVRTAGGRLRVTAHLTDVASGYQLWSERFDREAADIFAVQDEIAAGVVDAVKARLAPGVRTIQARPQARNLDAYRSYLMGRHLRYAKEDHGGAVRAFEEAVRLDPTYAPSWTALAESLALAAHSGVVPSRAACAAARKDAPPIVSEGWLLAALGEIDAAFEVLTRAADDYQLWLYYTGVPGSTASCRSAIRGAPDAAGVAVAVNGTQIPGG